MISPSTTFCRQLAANAAGDDFGTIDVATGGVHVDRNCDGCNCGHLVQLWPGITPAIPCTRSTYQQPAPTISYTIDTGTLEATLVRVPIPADIVIAIAINGAGEMFGIDLTPDALIAIDKTDATAATIGPLGFCRQLCPGYGF